MAYVVQQPRSLTNPTDDFRVVETLEWAAYADGERKSLPTYGTYSTYAEAQAQVDELNRPKSES
jgi:hypothetical protein